MAGEGQGWRTGPKEGVRDHQPGCWGVSTPDSSEVDWSAGHVTPLITTSGGKAKPSWQHNRTHRRPDMNCISWCNTYKYTTVCGTAHVAALQRQTAQQTADSTAARSCTDEASLRTTEITNMVMVLQDIRNKYFLVQCYGILSIK